MPDLLFTIINPIDGFISAKKSTLENNLLTRLENISVS